MMLEQIVTSPVTRRNPPNPPFKYAAFNDAIAIEIPDARPMKRQAAEALLLDTERTLKQAAIGLMGFRLAIAGPLSRADFEDAYSRFIVEPGLHVWLTPVEAGDIWAAMRAIMEVER